MSKQRTKVLKPRGRPRVTSTQTTTVQPPLPGAPVAEAPPAAPASYVPSVDIERFSQNVARMMEEGGKALAAYLKPREDGSIRSEPVSASAQARMAGQR